MEKYLDENKAAYDNLAKRVLSRKIILAHILKETVTEFSDCSVEEIEKKYIEGEPYLGDVGKLKVNGRSGKKHKIQETFS